MLGMRVPTSLQNGHTPCHEEMQQSLRISVITAAYNNYNTINDALASLAEQTWGDVEHIVIDNCSTDGTSEKISRWKNADRVYIREPDSSLYDALNKGVTLSSGDVVGFLHADDVFHNACCLQRIASTFLRTKTDAVYGDLEYFKQTNKGLKVTRRWKAGYHSVAQFRNGWMPPHPTLYLRRSVIDKHGLFNTDLQISADYEAMLRYFVKGAATLTYIPETLVRMRVGGKSTASLANRMKANREDVLAWRLNNLKPPLGIRVLKPLRKISQFLIAPRTATASLI